MRHCSCAGEASLSGQRVSSVLPFDGPFGHLCESPAGGRYRAPTYQRNTHAHSIRSMLKQHSSKFRRQQLLFITKCFSGISCTQSCHPQPVKDKIKNFFVIYFSIFFSRNTHNKTAVHLWELYILAADPLSFFKEN